MILNGIIECARRLSASGERRARVPVAGSFKFLAAATLCFVWTQTYAAISTITVTASMAPQSTDFSNVPVAFQQFNPILGKLSSVEIILQGTGELTQQYENLAHHTASEEIAQTLDLSLTLPNTDETLLKAHQVENHHYSEAPFDGNMDFGGTSGDTGIYGVTASKDKLLKSPNQLALFTGSGIADFFLSSQSSFHASNSDKNSITEAEILAGANITIIYNFIAAPEPASYGLLAGALTLIVTLIRFRTRNPRAEQS